MKRIRVVQFGISHEHAVDKLTTIRALPDEFELVGLVDDRDGASPRYPLRRPDSVLEGVPLLAEEQVWAAFPSSRIHEKLQQCNFLSREKWHCCNFS